MGSQARWDQFMEVFLNHVSESNPGLAHEIWNEYASKRAAVRRSIERRVETDTTIAQVSGGRAAALQKNSRRNRVESSLDVDDVYDAFITRVVHRHRRIDGCYCVYSIE